MEKNEVLHERRVLASPDVQVDFSILRNGDGNVTLVKTVNGQNYEQPVELPSRVEGDKPIKLASLALYKSPYLEIGAEVLMRPNGKIMVQDLVTRIDGVHVMPIHDDRTVSVLKQYRRAQDKFVWRLPTGGIDDGEEHLAAAHRELAEEIGYKASTMDFQFSAGGSATVRQEIFGYLATDLKEIPNHKPDVNEDLEVFRKPLTEVADMAARGDFPNSDASRLILLVERNY